MTEANHPQRVAVERFTPGTLEHPSTVVFCNSRPELAYVLAWCDDRGKKVAPHMRERSAFPYWLSVHGDIVGWCELMDRAVYYMPFAAFLAANGQGVR